MNLWNSLDRFLVLTVGLLAVTGAVDRAMALQPDEIALVVNSNVPEGGKLAEFYAQQRHIPDNRILVLDLPKTDQMPCKQYEDEVVPQVRDFIHSGQLENKVKCFVTFYGVPLRIEPRINTTDEADEEQKIRQQLLSLPDQIRPAVEAVEALTKQLNADFTPESLGDLDHLLRRKAVAFKEFTTQLSSIPDKGRQTEMLGQFLDAAQPLIGDKTRIDKLALAISNPPAGAVPVDPKQYTQATQDYRDFIAQAAPLEKTPNDPEARSKLREIVHDHFGLIQYLDLLRDQADYLDTRDSGAAFDSELSMVEWNVYPHKAFFPNPLYYSARPTSPWPAMMVSRLDAPQPDTVKSMITTAIQVEQAGLTGKFIIDSRGIKPGDNGQQKDYGVYDQYLRDLYKLLTDRTKLEVHIDEKPEVLPANSFDNVAVYVGWYSVRNYIPCCKFNPGAVGFHVASYELITLRSPGENGWVHGLLNDGVIGTLGPVAEPYLETFPHPDEYFPLLLTGKLTLAEVYWKTIPVTSWMMACVGDPLYTPYLKNPAMTVEDLPFRLRQAIPGQATPLPQLPH